MNNEKKLRFWTQKVLPQVYDDALSYSELLNKVVAYLNNTVEDVEELADSFSELQGSFSSLQSQVEIDEKLSTVYRGLTLSAASLEDLSETDPPAYYLTGYYTPRVFQAGLPTGITISAENQYQYVIMVINGFTEDPAEAEDLTKRTWILYGPNATLWWANGQTPSSESWVSFDPSAVDVAEIREAVEQLQIDLHTFENQTNRNIYYFDDETLNISSRGLWLSGTFTSNTSFRCNVPLNKQLPNDVNFTLEACTASLYAHDGTNKATAIDFLTETGYSANIRLATQSLICIELIKTGGYSVNPGAAGSVFFADKEALKIKFTVGT